MSRIGKMPVQIPSGVSFSQTDELITIKGPKGELTQFTMPEVTIAQEGETLVITRRDDEKVSRAKHGLMRALLQNMVQGVTEGFSKQLEVNGVGFKVNLSGKTLKMALGFSHEVVFTAPEGIDLAVEGNVITVSGVSKQQVGQAAAEIRALKKPEPYKGKGIKYVDEYIVRKSGKAAGGDK